jgi:hypothetical protein
MLGHRVNSEGLRRRAIAPSGGAPKSFYIGCLSCFCQPCRREKNRSQGIRKRQFLPGSGTAGQGPSLTLRCDSESASRERSAPHCGHIPPPFLVNCRYCRDEGQATASLEFLGFGLRTWRRPLGPPHRRGMIAQADCIPRELAKSGTWLVGDVDSRDRTRGRGRGTWSWTKLDCAA